MNREPSHRFFRSDAGMVYINHKVGDEHFGCGIVNNEWVQGLKWDKDGQCSDGLHHIPKDGSRAYPPSQEYAGRGPCPYIDPEREVAISVATEMVKPGFTNNTTYLMLAQALLDEIRLRNEAEENAKFWRQQFLDRRTDGGF